MGIIGTLKDVIVLAQKSNDVEITQKIISVQQEIIDMQEKIQKLQDDNKRLKEKIKNKNSIERYRNIPIITFKEDKPKIIYCARCYGKEEAIIPMQVIDNDRCQCPNCKCVYYISYSPDESKIKEGINNVSI